MTRDFLLIDDDETFLQVLARVLARRGIGAVVATTGKQALHLADHQSFAAVIVDLCLAQESGLPLIAPLRARQPTAALLVLTGYASIATAVAAVKQGATDYLPKPATVTQILRAVAVEAPPSVSVPDHPINLSRLEWEHLQRVLQDNQGNLSATARQLKLHRRTLQRKLAKRPPRES